MADLKHDPRNARKHPERNRELIRRSLQEVGAFRSIAVDGDNIVRAGNGVYEQAQELGLTVRVVDAAPGELIAVRRGDLRGQQAERAALFDNQTSETSEWDTDVLMQLSSDEPQTVEGVFDAGELEELLDGVVQEGSVEQQLSQERAAGIGKGLGDGATKIKPVLYADQVEVFEQAVAKTGMENRGQAIISICKYYLEHHEE